MDPRKSAVHQAYALKSSRAGDSIARLEKQDHVDELIDATRVLVCYYL